MTGGNFVFMLPVMFRSIARPLRLAIEFIAGFIAIFILIGVLVVWRLSSSPISSSFLTPYVESAIVKLVPGTQVKIDHTLLTWDNADRSITLEVNGLHMTNKEGKTITDVPIIDIRLSVLGLLVGRVEPSALLIQHPQVALVRAADGTLLFGGMEATGGGEGGDIRETLMNIIGDLEQAHFTRRLQVSGANFSIHDQQAGSDWTLGIPDVLIERHIGGLLTGEAKIQITQKDQSALAVIHYEHDTGASRHKLTARFSGINPGFLAVTGSKAAIVNMPLTGELSFGFDDHFNLVTQEADIHGDAGTLDYADLWEAPLPVNALNIKGSYDKQGGKLDVTKIELDLGGPKISVTGGGTTPAPGITPARDLDFELAVELTGLPMNDFGKVWPKSAIPGAREWIIANMSKGTFDHGNASFKGSLVWNDLSNINVTEARGTVAATGATVKYIDGMPPVVGVNAKADFDLNQMTVAVSGGGIDELKLQPSTIHITDFEKNVQNIDLPIHLIGPVPAVLKLIDYPPLGYAKAVGLKPESVSGTLDGTVDLKFPLIASLLMRDVAITTNANLDGVASNQLVPGIDISQGELAMTLDKNGFGLQGTAAIDKVPMHITWQQSFDETGDKPFQQATVTGVVSGDQWSQLGIDMLAKSQGPINVTFQMGKTQKATSFSGALDMKAATIQVDELNWKKEADAPASLTFAADMPPGKDINVSSIEAVGPGLKIKGNAVLMVDSLNPVSLNFDPFTVGRTDAVLHYTQTPGPQGKLTFDIQGGSFDVSGLTGGKDPGHTDQHTREFRIKLGKLYTSDEGFVSNAVGNAIRDAQGWSEISLHGLADGGHQLDIDLSPKPDGHRVLSVNCDDFGKALKGLGFTNTVKSGKLEIVGVSDAEHPRQINGTVKIGSFEVKDLPALVVLMNATSPFGIVDLFTGTLDFDRLEGNFVWQGDMLQLQDVRAAGNSVGMTIEGNLDMNSGGADLHGTMAPFSMVNRILNYIPLIGDMLTGGDGQGLFGVNYSIKGTLDKPEVSVNPASLLTPGFLRNLFFSEDTPPPTPLVPATNNPGKSDEAPAPSSAPVPAVQKGQPVQSNINKKK